MSGFCRWTLVLVCVVCCGVGACGGSSARGGAGSAGGLASSGVDAGGHDVSVSGGGAAGRAGVSASAATAAVGGALGDAGAKSSGEAPADGGSSAGSESAGSAGMPSRTLPVASPGCALAKRAPTETGVVTYSLPDTYDGVTPWPLIIELPATNVPPRIAVTRNGTKALNQRYVVV